jgi:hypothetical protein
MPRPHQDRVRARRHSLQIGVIKCSVSWQFYANKCYLNAAGSAGSAGHSLSEVGGNLGLPFGSADSASNGDL